MSFRFIGTALSILSGSGAPPATDCLVTAAAQPFAAVAPMAQTPMAGAPAVIRAEPLVADAHPVDTPPPKVMAMAAVAPQPRSATGTTPTPPAAEAGGWRVHLASYHNAAWADQGWSELRHALPAVLGALTPSKVTVTFKGKGTFVRLLAGPFEDRAAAEKVCALLSQSHQYCHPLAPGHEAS